MLEVVGSGPERTHRETQVVRVVADAGHRYGQARDRDAVGGANGHTDGDDAAFGTFLVQGEPVAADRGEHVARQRRKSDAVDWDAVLAAYEAVRPEHCRRVVTTSRSWGRLWHLDGQDRQRRNNLLRNRDVHDYTFVDWLYGPTAVDPDDEPEMFTPVPLEPTGHVS
ncbi:3-hydroxybenzoate 6-hydroxylase [Streptomyces sp. YIM 130001]|nr:3-hydroxybenzoate 6-hydroxylase [Streptomyces sp. YIM 130001]